MATPSVYQRVGNAAVTPSDYDASVGKPYLRFNGVNQWLQTNSIDFTYGDKMFVAAGVRKFSDAATGIVAENTIGNGSVTLGAPTGGGVNKFAFSSRQSIDAQANTALSVYSAPITSVISGIGDISAPSATLRVNGVQAAQNNATQGTGNYGNYPLYIGVRAGGGLWFNGRLYGLVVAGKQASDAEILSTEKYLNDKTAALDWRDVTDSSSFRWNSATASPDAE